MTSVGVGAIGSVYAYLMMFAYGLPCYLILWRLGRGNWINTTVIALIPGLIYGIWFEFGKMILWYAWFALAVSVSCWLLLKRGDRPAD